MNGRWWQLLLMLFAVLFGLQLIFGLSFTGENAVNGALLIGSAIAWVVELRTR